MLDIKHTLLALDTSVLFDPVTIARGTSYYKQGRVRELTMLPEVLTITAEVKGSSSYPYNVELVFVQTNKGLRLDKAECSCPMEGSCKHCHAALIAATKQNPAYPFNSFKEVTYSPDDCTSIDTVKPEINGVVPTESIPLAVKAAPLSYQHSSWIKGVEGALRKDVPEGDERNVNPYVLTFSFEPTTL